MIKYFFFVFFSKYFTVINTPVIQINTQLSQFFIVFFIYFTFIVRYIEVQFVSFTKDDRGSWYRHYPIDAFLYCYFCLFTSKQWLFCSTIFLWSELFRWSLFFGLVCYFNLFSVRFGTNIFCFNKLRVILIPLEYNTNSASN